MAVPEARKRLFCGERLIHIKLRLTSGPDTIIEGGSKRLFLLDLADDSTLVKRSPRRHERESLASEQSEVREGAQRMNRIDRLTANILLLHGGRRTTSEIARRFEVSKRTLFRDSAALGEMGVPIVTEAGVHGGYTLMPDYSQLRSS